MMKQRAEIILSQIKKVNEDINMLLGYLTVAETDLTKAKEEEDAIHARIDEYRKREEYYQAAEVKLQEARDLQFSLSKEREQLAIDRGLVEKEKTIDRERKLQLDALEKRLFAKQQRLQSLLAD